MVECQSSVKAPFLANPGVGARWLSGLQPVCLFFLSGAPDYSLPSLRAILFVVRSCGNPPLHRGLVSSPGLVALQVYSACPLWTGKDICCTILLWLSFDAVQRVLPGGGDIYLSCALAPSVFVVRAWCWSSQCVCVAASFLLCVFVPGIGGQERPKEGIRGTERIQREATHHRVQSVNPFGRCAIRGCMAPLMSRVGISRVAAAVLHGAPLAIV